MRHALLTVICSVVLGLGTAPAQADFDDPLFFYTPPLDGPCGLVVDSTGDIYISDYYSRSVSIFSPEPEYANQSFSSWSGRPNPHTGPLDDPCGLALDSSDTLYLNDYHRDVVRFPSPVSPATAQVIDTGDPSDPFANPTGVTVSPVTNHAYVDDRIYIAEYDSTGAFVQRIGEATLQDGYGIAASGYPATAGYLYVPDFESDTVKVYNPAFSTTTPKETIAGPPGGFDSLKDSAVAVDNATGEVYVVDTLGPQLTEEPWAVVYVFASNGAYEGRLKHATIDAAPAGLAVDNSGGSTQSRVYVTSGITEKASFYGYPAHAATDAAAAPLVFEGTADSSLAAASSAPVAQSAGIPSLHTTVPKATTSSISQKGNLRVSVGGELRPKRLPRQGAAPIAVSVGGQISTTDQSLPPLLRALRIDLNRHGRIDNAGLPTCPYERIQPGTSSHALSACRSALVGKGSFTADITLAGQEPYPTKGKLLVFNGVSKGKPVLFGHIYSPRPFATSFVILFKVKKLGKGPYGTSLIAPLPAAMKAWGRLTGITMTLSRRYSYKGESHSYISSGCPAPKGFTKAVFPLAQASFAFAGGQRLSSVLGGACRARG